MKMDIKSLTSKMAVIMLTIDNDRPQHAFKISRQIDSTNGYTAELIKKLIDFGFVKYRMFSKSKKYFTTKRGTQLRELLIDLTILGITPLKINKLVLKMVAQHDKNKCITALIDKTGMTHPGGCRAFNKLVDEGIFKTDKSDKSDNRIKQPILTEKGESIRKLILKINAL